MPVLPAIIQAESGKEAMGTDTHNVDSCYRYNRDNGFVYDSPMVFNIVLLRY